MSNDAFEWDAEKAAANWRNHGVPFDQAVKAYLDPFAVELIDEREDYGEERINLVGMCGDVLLHVTYTERGERVRLSRPGGRKNMSKTTIFAKTRPDGSVMELLPDGRERPFPERPMRPMTEAQIAAAAAADPDARPMTPKNVRLPAGCHGRRPYVARSA